MKEQQNRRPNETEHLITSSSEIRLMDDCDTEDMSLWIETTVEGGSIRLQEGDLILKVK